MFALLCEFGFFNNFLNLFFLLFLQIIFGLWLRDFYGFFGRNSCHLLLGSSSFVGGVFNLDEGGVVSDHFFGHLFEFLGLFVDPLHLRNNYMVRLVIQNAVIPDKLDIRKASLHSLIHIVVQIPSYCPQIHGFLHN